MMSEEVSKDKLNEMIFKYMEFTLNKLNKKIDDEPHIKSAIEMVCCLFIDYCNIFPNEARMFIEDVINNSSEVHRDFRSIISNPDYRTKEQLYSYFVERFRKEADTNALDISDRKIT